MTAGCFLDTNVLLYAVSTTPAEAPKWQLARYLLNEDDWTLSVPVSYWDAAILAAAQQSGSTLVLSEDMTDGETYGSVTVRNPCAVIRS